LQGAAPCLEHAQDYRRRLAPAAGRWVDLPDRVAHPDLPAGADAAPARTRRGWINRVLCNGRAQLDRVSYTASSAAIVHQEEPCLPL
jgi:hypothetical protein